MAWRCNIVHTNKHRCVKPCASTWLGTCIPIYTYLYHSVPPTAVHTVQLWMVRDGETVICNLQVAGVSNPKASLSRQTGPTSHVVHPNGASMGHISVISIGWESVWNLQTDYHLSSQRPWKWRRQRCWNHLKPTCFSLKLLQISGLWIGLGSKDWLPISGGFPK